MATVKISEYFDDFADAISADIGEGKILKLIFDEGLTGIECVAAFQELVGFDSVTLFESRMRKALNSSFRLSPKFTPDMLSAGYFADICKFMKSRFPFVNGFFDDAEVVMDGSVFRVTLKHGGYELMKKAGVNNAFSGLVWELFSTKADIELDGVLFNDMEEHEKAQQAFFASLPQPDIAAYEQKSAAHLHRQSSARSMLTLRACICWARAQLC